MSAAFGKGTKLLHKQPPHTHTHRLWQPCASQTCNCNVVGRKWNTEYATFL